MKTVKLGTLEKFALLPGNVVKCREFLYQLSHEFGNVLILASVSIKN